MNRAVMVDKARERDKCWDMIIIGGGATGVGTALEASSRGYETLLLERHDFGKGTSSRSTKMVHGGVRYLQQGNVKLVLEALKERGRLRQNAPHLVHSRRFMVPDYRWWETPFYGIGLKLYDMLSGAYSFGNSTLVSPERVVDLLPTIETDGLRGGVIYYDGQFDDARLLINMAQTVDEAGGVLINYMRVSQLTHSDSRVTGVIANDLESNQEIQLKAKVVINATGVYADEVRLLDDPNIMKIISPSQGVHIVLDRSFLPGDVALMIPRTDDGRVLFAIPWQDHVVVGTTDTPVDSMSIEPVPFEQEIDFLVKHTARYLAKDPVKEDILSAFAGLRPLVSPAHEKNTKTISREHMIEISKNGLVTITGGKWTTYRKMAEDTIDCAAAVAGLPAKPSISKTLKIHGYCERVKEFGTLEHYGSDAPKVQELIDEKPEWSELVHPDVAVRAGEVIWAARHEMARTVEDFLARRRRVLFQDARKSIEMAPRVADLIARETGRDTAWRKEQVDTYTKLATQYLIG